MHINNLIAYIDKYLAQEGLEPRILEEKIKALKNLIYEG